MAALSLDDFMAVVREGEGKAREKEPARLAQAAARGPALAVYLAMRPKE